MRIQELKTLGKELNGLGVVLKNRFDDLFILSKNGRLRDYNTDTIVKGRFHIQGQRKNSINLISQ